MFRDRVPRAEKLQAERAGAARAGGGGRGADDHVGRRRGLRARRDGLEPRAAARQLAAHYLLNRKVRPLPLMNECP